MFCFCLILLFVLTCLPNNGRSHQSNATFCTSLSHLLWRRSFCTYIVFENYLKKTEILSVVHLVDIYAKNLDERGRNFMCERTLPSLLVNFYYQFASGQSMYSYVML